MIKLYDEFTEDFNNNGIGPLKEAYNPDVSECLNGEFCLTLEYPIKGKYAKYITNRNIIKCDVGFEEEQLFRIKRIVPTLNSLKITAYHISYDLAENFLEDIYPQKLNGQAFLDWILSKTQYKHRFIAFSDIANIATARYVRKNPIEAIIGDLDNSFVNLFGGELLRNNFKLSMLKQRGKDNGYIIKYRKNLTGLEITEDDSNLATRLMPKGYDGLLLPEKYIDSPLIKNYSHPYIKVLECSDIKVKTNSSEEAGYNTEEEAFEAMRQRCRDAFEKDNVDKTNINIKVDFIDLKKTTRYKKYSHLQDLELGDIVTVIGKNNVSYKLRIVKTNYDPYLKRFTKLELGEFKTNYVVKTNSTLNSTLEAIDQSANSVLAKAKQNATEQLTYAMGGFVHKTQNELFIMDTDKPETAKKVWRWNLNGLGYSKSGINGPYELAMTQDGKIVADFITTGQMDVARIKGLETLAIAASQIHLEGYTTINAGFAIDKNGNMTCTNATINGGTITLGDGTKDNPTFNIVGKDGKQAWVTTDQVYLNGTLGRINLQCDSQLGIFISGKNLRGFADLIGDDTASQMGTYFNRADGSQVSIDAFADEDDCFFRVGDSKNNCIIYPDKIYVANKPCIVSHAGVVSLGYKYYTNGTDDNCGYLEITTTNKGTVAASCWQSDGRLKENIKEAEINAIDIINLILHRTFKWKDSNGIEEVGYIAQELENVKKNFVIKVPQRDCEGNIIDEVYQINETKIIPYITKAIQELSKELQEQKNTNQFLLSKLNLQKEYDLNNQKENITKTINNKIKQYDEKIKFTKYEENQKTITRKVMKNRGKATNMILEEGNDEKNN